SRASRAPLRGGRSWLRMRVSRRGALLGERWRGLRFLLAAAEFRVCVRRLLFKRVNLAHDDRCRRPAEPRHHMLDPVRGRLGPPTAMLPAVGATKFTGVRPFADTDDADIPAAWFLAIDGAIEFHREADHGLAAEEIEGHRRRVSSIASAASLRDENSPSDRRSRSSASKASPRGRMKPTQTRPS